MVVPEIKSFVCFKLSVRNKREIEELKLWNSELFIWAIYDSTGRGVFSQANNLPSTYPIFHPIILHNDPKLHVVKISVWFTRLPAIISDSPQFRQIPWRFRPKMTDWVSAKFFGGKNSEKLNGKFADILRKDTKFIHILNCNIAKACQSWISWKMLQNEL